MTLGDYTRVNFVDEVTPLNQVNMNNMDAKIDELDGAVDTAVDDINTAESDIIAVENRATAIENDIDYPSTVKQKAITDTGEDGGVEGGGFNGDFEYGSGSQTSAGWISDEKYNWYHSPAATCVASFDDEVSHSGKQSLKIYASDVTGKTQVYTGTTDLNVMKKHAFPTKPSTKYKLSCWIKTDNVPTNCTWLECKQYDSTGVVGSTKAVSKLSGTNDWTYSEIVFTSDADSTYIRVTCAHLVAGNISTSWFDDIKLEQIDTQAVNTQMDVPAGVSIEGVTTTDNIDQSQTNGDAALWAVRTGFTQGQTFTPAESKHTGVNVRTSTAGSYGDGTCTLYKWDTDYATTIAGNIISSVIVPEANITNGGDTYFSLPCILETGSIYLYHFTGTGADASNTWKVRGNNTSDDYSGGQIWADGVSGNYDANFKQYFAKHTESPIIEANSAKLDLTGTKLLTGATITVNADGSGKYIYSQTLSSSEDGNHAFRSDLESIGSPYAHTNYPKLAIGSGISNPIVVKHEFADIATKLDLRIGMQCETGRTWKAEYSLDNITWNTIIDTNEFNGISIGTVNTNSDIVYIKISHVAGGSKYVLSYELEATLDCQAELPIFAPSSEVSSETSDLVQNPIDISEDGFWQLKYDLTGWGSRTITMLADEATWEAQAVSANYIYIYDSNGTSAWTWDERNGLIPPADRTSGAVMAKFLVGDNQIKSSVNDGSMKANFNLSWDEESLRASINRLTEIANLQYPIVVEVDDVPAIDLQNEPTGASAETGYTNDVTSLRQTAAATPAIAYTGLLPRENRFSEWLDITVVCDDGDGVLQGKLYAVDGTLIETYADLEANPVLTISNPDYKYSRERLVLQISTSTETTSTAWSVSKIKWRYQYNG